MSKITFESWQATGEWLSFYSLKKTLRFLTVLRTNMAFRYIKREIIKKVISQPIAKFPGSRGRFERENCYLHSGIKCS